MYSCCSAKLYPICLNPFCQYPSINLCYTDILYNSYYLYVCTYIYIYIYNIIELVFASHQLQCH